ncbi:hypothetical protein [Microbacterium sp. NPDC057650]|uniref:hypothetical protein n=1 Tax=unclassified Microbacterium TaxID=2609290 RepID=UPI00366A770A
MTIISTKRHGVAAALLAAVALTVALAGCSASPGSDDRGSSGSSTGANGDLKSGDEAAAYAEWSDKFNACMKDKGFDMSTPGESNSQADAEAMTKAADGCYKKVGEPPADPNVPSNDELNEQMLAFAKCMRDAGYDYPDPKIDPNGGVAMGQAMPADWDPADIDACSKKAGMGMTGASGGEN